MSKNQKLGLKLFIPGFILGMIIPFIAAFFWPVAEFWNSIPEYVAIIYLAVMALIWMPGYFLLQTPTE